MTFTHNHKNDTIIERDGKEIVFIFVNDGFTYDTDSFRFPFAQGHLFHMLADYFIDRKNADVFGDLTIPQQDALWTALVYMNNNEINL